MEFLNGITAFLAMRVEALGLSAQQVPLWLVTAALLLPVLLAALSRQVLAFFAVLLVICGLLAIDPASTSAGALAAIGAYVASVLMGVIAAQSSYRNRAIGRQLVQLRADVDRLAATAGRRPSEPVISVPPETVVVPAAAAAAPAVVVAPPVVAKPVTATPIDRAPVVTIEPAPSLAQPASPVAVAKPHDTPADPPIFTPAPTPLDQPLVLTPEDRDPVVVVPPATSTPPIDNVTTTETKPRPSGTIPVDEQRSPERIARIP